VDAACIKINYYALIVAILRGCNPETAFEMVQADHPDRVRPQISKADVADMVKFKEKGLTYEKIGAIYGVNKYFVFNRVRKIRGSDLGKLSGGDNLAKAKESY